MARHNGWEIEAGVSCVVCPKCAFTFDASHQDWPDGGWSCPLCAEIELRERLERAVSLIEKLPCECYDEPTLAPTDNPRVVECERCSFLASGVST